MHRLRSVSTLRFRAAALTGAVVAGMAMVAASPASAAHAAVGVQAIPAAPPASAHTLTLHAHATRTAAGGKVSPDDDPGDITCTISILAPAILGDYGTPGAIEGNGSIFCTFDSNGAVAYVPYITVSTEITVGGVIEAAESSGEADTPGHGQDALMAPCADVDGDVTTAATVDLPDGYVPSQISGSTSRPFGLSLGGCPSDYIQTPDETGKLLSTAVNDLQLHGLTGVAASTMSSCLYAAGRVVVQTPNPNGWALKGGTVFLITSSGRPKNPCP